MALIKKIKDYFGLFVSDIFHVSFHATHILECLLFVTQYGIWINEIPSLKEVIFLAGNKSTSKNTIRDMQTVENIKAITIDHAKLYTISLINVNNYVQ